jgi:hypothetical protein
LRHAKNIERHDKQFKKYLNWIIHFTVSEKWSINFGGLKLLNIIFLIFFINSACIIQYKMHTSGYVLQIKKIFILCLIFRRRWFLSSCSVNGSSVSNILCKQSLLSYIFWRKFPTCFMQNIFDKNFLHLHFMVLSIKFIHNLLLIFWQVFSFDLFT